MTASDTTIHSAARRRIALRHAVMALAVLAAPGCAGLDPEAASDLGGRVFTRAAPQKVQVANDTVAIAGPQGFCVDLRATRDGGEGAFVLMASCAALTGREDAPNPAAPAVLTASVSAEPGTGGRDEDRALSLARFFSSERGRAMLALDGRAESVTVHDMFDRDGVFFLHLSDSSAGAAEGLRNTYWRALFDVNSRLVSASVMSFETQPLDDKTSRAVLRDFAARIRSASAPLGYDAPQDLSNAVARRQGSDGR